MAGFTSMDNFVENMTTSGNTWRTEWFKATPPTTAAAAGEWFCMLRGVGNPTADSIMNTGTNLAFQVLSGNTTNINSISAGPNASSGTSSTDYKFITSASVFSVAATTVPTVLMLVDLLGFYRITGVTVTGNQNLTNSTSINRYTDGMGVQCFIYNTNATPMGAATPNISITYTRTGGRGTASTPVVLPIGKTAAANGLILYSGTGVGKYGPFMPLGDQDFGMVNVTQINLSASYLSGEFSIVLCKPLMTIQTPALGVTIDKDFVNQMPSFPKVYDNACLTWLIHNGVATPAGSYFYGHLDFAWS